MSTVFAPELGHTENQKELLIGIKQNRLPHAFLFHGPEGSGKEAFALALAQLLNSTAGVLDPNDPPQRKISTLQHPDVKLVFPTPAKTNMKEGDYLEVLKEKASNPFKRSEFRGKNTFIGINTIRELKRESAFKLYEGKRKVFIITEAHTMRVEAANALLKLLEEPPDNLVLILITSNIYKILTTIKSRCQIMYFASLGEGQLTHLMEKYAGDVPDEKRRLLIRLSGYNIKRVFDFLDRDVLAIRESAIDLLRKSILIHRGQELFSVLEPIARNKDKAETRLVLWFLLLWFQDILHLKYGAQDRTGLFNRDKLETLQKFWAYIPNADLPEVVWHIEKALQDLNDTRNFNPLLLLTNLTVKINLCLKK
ncbi:MAG: ATP-binding protein [Calditrichia bacterium]